MKLKHSLLPIAILAAIAAPAAHAEVAIDVIADSEVSFEGLVQADMAWYRSDRTNLNASPADGDKSDFSMRRAELVLKGKGPGNNEWVIGYDAYSRKWLDVNWRYKIGGNGNHTLTFGQFKQPNSLEELSSTKNNDFVAKALITNVFAVGRRVGVAYNYGDVNWGLTASLFGRELTRNNKQGNGFGLRGYFAPMSSAGNILHLGVSYARYDAERPAVGTNIKDSASFSARPGMDLTGANLISTGTINFADTISTVGLEAFWVHGPFKLQGEYMRTSVSRLNGLRDWRGTGGYVSAVWNVTGETWGYRNGVPTTKEASEPSSGMWQLGLRYDTMDLNDGNVVTVGGVPTRIDGILGGKMSTWTFGVNWYWRQNFKFSLNYVTVDSNKYSLPARNYLSDNPSGLNARVQFYW